VPDIFIARKRRLAVVEAKVGFSIKLICHCTVHKLGHSQHCRRTIGSQYRIPISHSQFAFWPLLQPIEAIAALATIDLSKYSDFLSEIVASGDLRG
jgi:hypothetical protein